MYKTIRASDINSIIGTNIAVSDWITIDQKRINKFADATNDHQFIHIDPDRAKPLFGSTIAHGFLSLSLIEGILYDQKIGLVFADTKMKLNYGLDKVRFLSPVLSGSDVRISITCLDIIEKKPGNYLVKNQILMEIKDIDKPAFIAETLSMFIC
jgi:acyl dehydratase